MVARAVVDSVVEGLAVAVGLVVTVARVGVVVTLAAARKVVAARAVADLVRAVAATVATVAAKVVAARAGEEAEVTAVESGQVKPAVGGAPAGSQRGRR